MRCGDMFVRLTIVSLSSILLLAAAWPHRAGGRPTQPNIVLILVDDMGYGDPGCFNSQSKISTPHIDQLAKQGMRFTDAHAPGPLCHMSRYGLLTGRYPFRTDVTRWPTHSLIEPDQTTIASVAKRAGYHTVMVGKWHLGFQEEGYDKPLRGGPVDCGFDQFYGMRASTDIPPYFYIQDDQAVKPPTEHIDDDFSEDWSKIQGRRRLAGGIAPGMKLEKVLPVFTSQAVRVIKGHAKSQTNGKQPLLLYLAYTAPHTPWLPSDEFKGTSKAGLYGDFASMVDDEIGKVLDALDQSQIADDTLVIFTSDNGPCWRETDVEKFGHSSTGGFRGMKSDAWEGGHRMPMIVRWPGQVEPNSTSDQLVCFTDFLATFAAIMDVDLPAEAGPDSVDFSSTLLSKSHADKGVRESFVMQAGSRPSMMMVRDGDWKLITELGSGGFSKPKYIEPSATGPRGQLYNLADDPFEEKNLYQLHPDIVSRLTVLLNDTVKNQNTRSTIRSQAVNRGTLKGKVMCGYQGWFNCEGDGMELGWTHWGKRGKKFAPGSVTVDLWPDVSEYDDDELYETGFKHTGGKVAKVFSSANHKTVLRHFQWMREYGIDGAFVQRFANGLSNDRILRHRNTVLRHASDSANQTGRTFVVMYDLSGLPAGGVQTIEEDWHNLRETLQIDSNPAYQFHEGKPLVAVWGVGFGSETKPREYSLAECEALIKFFKADNCSVMLGIPTGWRELKRDSIPDPHLHEVLQLADVLSPWTVGRYRTLDDISNHAKRYWRIDNRWAKQRDLDYMPVVFPGFSWHNLKGDKLNAIPRLKGQFLWKQIVEAKRANCDMLYFAMFDEVDEGTAIFKCTNDPPVANGGKFIDYEGLPSDFYLNLAGKAGMVLRNEIRTTGTLPKYDRSDIAK